MTKSFSKYHVRTLVLSSVVILAWAGLTIRLFQVQVLSGNELSQFLKQQGENRVILPAVRGTIRDRNGAPLAQNVIHYSFAIRPQEVEDRKTLIETFSKTTGRSPHYYKRKIDSPASFVFLERNLKREVSHRLLGLKDRGLVIRRHGYRSYPHHTVASQVIGFTNVDNMGLEGVEKELDTHLRGRDGWLILQTDGKGRTHKNHAYPREEPVDGSDVFLTIDLEYQAILQSELKEHLISKGAVGAMGILMDPYSGRILAMASLPDYDPNSHHNYVKDHYKNRVITDQFEPGSTFKIVPATAALIHNSVPTDEEFNCEDGSYEFHGTVIKDWSDFGLLTFPQIIEHSSNVGIIKIAERVGSRNIYLCARRYGFGSLPGIRLPGETRGTLRAVDEWSAISLAEISLGHEVSVSALQLALAYGTIANGGFLMKPVLVDRIIHPSGRITYESSPQIIRRVAPKDVMKSLTDMLQRVVESGTGASARIRGWTLAGKTGTAQKYVDGAYSTTKFTSLFVGYLPAEKPQVLGLVVLDEPKIGYHWGGAGAAPVFGEIMKRIINTDDAIMVHTFPAPEGSDGRVSASGSPVHLMSTAFPVPRQSNAKKVRVPDVRGKSLRKAVNLLRNAGLKPLVQGSGTVRWQSPAPGNQVAKNSNCTIGLE